MKNKINDVDRILGMNRTMFFVIVALFCILSLSFGIYIQMFYRYAESDPFMLGIGRRQSQQNEEIIKLRTEFEYIFDNTIVGKTDVQNVKKKNKEKDLVWSSNVTTVNEKDKYNISVNVPQLNIDSLEAERINTLIEQDYVEKVEQIMSNSKVYTDYTVVYKAYLNGDLLSLIIKESITEGQTPQSAKIRTYNYNLNNDTQVKVEDIIKAKKYNISDVQEEIYEEIKYENEKDKDIQSQYENMKLRDVNDEMYKVERTENFLVDDNGYLYIIYAYGNKENTNKIDVVIFE